MVIAVFCLFSVLKGDETANAQTMGTVYLEATKIHALITTSSQVKVLFKVSDVKTIHSALKSGCLLSTDKNYYQLTLNGAASPLVSHILAAYLNKKAITILNAYTTGSFVCRFYGIMTK